MEKQTESKSFLSSLSLVSLLVLGWIASAPDAIHGQGKGKGASPESLDPYLKLLNEVSERRRMNVYFANEQTLFYGAQVGYVNVGRGNLTFQRRDLVAVGRIPLVIARAYDSALEGSGDFGPGWHLTAAETIEAEGRSWVYVDESASKHRFVPGVDGYELTPPGPNDIESLTPLGRDRLRLELRSGMVKMFHRIGKCFCLVRVEDRNGNVVELEYANGLLVELRQEAGRFIQLRRDRAGRIVSISDDQGRRVSYRYDADGHLEMVRDMGDYGWRYAYEGPGRLARAWDPMGSETFTVAYDPSGRVAEVVMPGDAFSFHYRGLETEVVDAGGHSNTFRQNVAGITVEVENALGFTSRVDLDRRHRVRRLARDGRTEALLGYRGDRLAWVARRGGRRTVFAYDSKGLLVEMSTSGEGSIMTLAYDDRGNLISRRDAAGERLYRYSSRGDLIEAALPGGDVYRFAVNDEGQIVRVTTGRDQTTRFDYQPDGKLALSAFADGSSHHYTYDALGLRSETLFDYGDGDSARVEYDHNPTGSLTRTYVVNAYGSISGNQLTLDDDQKIVGIEYFGRRRFAFDYEGSHLVRARSDDDKGQEAILFKYDALDRLVAVHTAMDQDLSYKYRPGEADLRLQFDAKTRPAESPRSVAGTTFASALEVLFNRTRRSAYGALAFEDSSMSFVLTGEHGVVAPDELIQQSWRRMRLNELESEDYKQHFEQPSSILFWPPEYQALNCCITCEIIYGVSCECLDLSTTRRRYAGSTAPPRSESARASRRYKQRSARWEPLPNGGP